MSKYYENVATLPHVREFNTPTGWIRFVRRKEVDLWMVFAKGADDERFVFRGKVIRSQSELPVDLYWEHLNRGDL